MNLATAQTTNGKRNWKQALKAAEMRESDSVSNLFGPTFFSRTPAKAWEKPERSAFVRGMAGEML